LHPSDGFVTLRLDPSDHRPPPRVSFSDNGILIEMNGFSQDGPASITPEERSIRSVLQKYLFLEQRLQSNLMKAGLFRRGRRVGSEGKDRIETEATGRT
jgi:hypothetical protein